MEEGNVRPGPVVCAFKRHVLREGYGPEAEFFSKRPKCAHTDS